MKLWRRRPISVDMTHKDLNFSNAMPPALVYISPGINCVSKRSSLVTNESLSKSHFLSDTANFNVTEKCSTNTNNTSVIGCPLQSFRDNNNQTTSVTFEDGTIRSSRLSNKGYLSPVSSEWLPVKDVMKIKRSASVPFHCQKSSTAPSLSAIERPSENTKAHTSFVEKIRTLFRTRSSSRSSKQGLAAINESKASKDKISLRSSRPRTKENEFCKSMYESSHVHDNEFSKKSKQSTKSSTSKHAEVMNKADARNVEKCRTENCQLLSKLNKKKEKVSNENLKKFNDRQIPWDQKKGASLKGFSESVISHTASSAAKCKPSPPYSTQRTSNSIIYRHCDKQLDKKTNNNPSNNQYKFPLPLELPQAVISSNYDKKRSELNKTEPMDSNTDKNDGGKPIQILEYPIQGQSNPPIHPIAFYSDNRKNSFELKAEIKRSEEDDYVTLAEVDLLVKSPQFMTQYVHGPIMRELAKSNHKYENIDMRDFQTNVSTQQPSVVVNYQNRNRIDKPPCSHQKKRPISCMAVVEAQNVKLPQKTNSYSSRGQSRSINPKSPYLSQYTKLYSLKLTDGEIMYTQHPDVLDCEIMTRSQTSCTYKTSAILGKEHSGKRSIDSGLVDDLSINFHSDSVIQS